MPSLDEFWGFVERRSGATRARCDVSAPGFSGALGSEDAWDAVVFRDDVKELCVEFRDGAAGAQGRSRGAAAAAAAAEVQGCGEIHVFIFGGSGRPIRRFFPQWEKRGVGLAKHKALSSLSRRFCNFADCLFD